MCGIAGIVAINGIVDEQLIHKLLKPIVHRGPDGSGYKIIDNVGIGHRRLSIIDLESGSQPMSNRNENIWITYNGELYNFQELKTELQSYGYSFLTNSDTEVIIYAYQHWGTECLRRFQGMFSFGIVDLAKRLILLARDHFGIKPLYIYRSKSYIAFGSELQQFSCIPDFKPEIDLLALDQYLWLQYIPAPLTIFKAVTKLLPAHFVTISFQGEVSEPIRYWDIDFTAKKIKSEKDWMEETEDVISKSVKSHLISDVPFGGFLSGGIDSTLVVKYMKDHVTHPVKTFSIGFEEAEFNELNYAGIVAKKYNTQHYTEIVKPDALGILPDLVRHYGEPFGDSSAIPTYYVSQLAKKHVTMVLSGDGGDECFAGYNSYINWLKHMPINYRKGLKKKIYPYLEMFFPEKYPKADVLNNWLKNIEYLDSDWRRKLWRQDHEQIISNSPAGFNALWESTCKHTLANKVQYMDLKTYMPYDILTKVDIVSMMHSLEVRTPLIDKNVWEFASQIPEELLINGKGGEWQGKQLIKKILLKDFSSDFVYRKKQGFAVPLKKWFSSNGQLKSYLNDKILSANSRLIDYFQPDEIKSLIKKNHTGGIWLMVFLEEWLCQFHRNTTRPNKS